MSTGTHGGADTPPGANAAALSRLLEQLPGVRPLGRDPRVKTHAWHLYLFRYDREAFAGLSKQDFVRALQAEGIPVSPGYVPLNRNRAIRQELAQRFGVEGDGIPPCPVAERASDEEVLWFPQRILLGSPGIWPRWRKPLTRCSVTPRIWFGSLRHRRFAGPIRAGFYIGSILPHSNRKKDGYDKGVSVAYTGVESVFATLGGGIGMDGIWTERRRRLAEELLRRTDPVTVTRLASRLKVSPRTIRYDLDALQPWFQEQGLQLSKRPRRGVQVMGPEERVQSALRQLASRGGNPYRHPLRPEERVRLILAYLLQDAQNTRVRVQDLADRLGVSRGTLLSDLKTVEEKLAAYRIRLLRIPVTASSWTPMNSVGVRPPLPWSSANWIRSIRIVRSGSLKLQNFRRRRPSRRWHRCCRGS